MDNNNGFFFIGNNNNGCVVGGLGIAPIAGTGLSMLGLQTLDRRMDYFGTSRVRAGFLVLPTLLLYGTGGVAYGHIRTTSLISTNVAGVPGGVVVPGVSFYDDARIKAGYTLGGGLERMFLPNWSVKFEALYYDLARTTFYRNFVQTLGPASGAPGLAISNTSTRTSFRNDGVIARAGINYHFKLGCAGAGGRALLISAAHCKGNARPCAGHFLFIPLHGAAGLISTSRDRARRVRSMRASWPALSPGRAVCAHPPLSGRTRAGETNRN
jgi:hypothetical protein